MIFFFLENMRVLKGMFSNNIYIYIYIYILYIYIYIDYIYTIDIYYIYTIMRVYEDINGSVL